MSYSIFPCCLISLIIVGKVILYMLVDLLDRASASREIFEDTFKQGGISYWRLACAPFVNGLFFGRRGD